MRSNKKGITIKLEKPFTSEHRNLLKGLLHIVGDRYDEVILEFRLVSRIDSMGIGILVVLYRKITRKIGGKMSIINPQPQVIDILKAIKLDRIFDITEEELNPVG